MARARFDRLGALDLESGADPLPMRAMHGCAH